MNKFPPPQRTRRGTALIVVLMFVVLMTVVVLAFFVKATAFRGLSQSAVSEFKADTLARSALAITVADLREEIRKGSTTKIAGNATLFYPTNAANAIPMRSGHPPLEPDGTDPAPNLIRRSVRSDPIASPGVGSRASAASSLTPSWNGRFVSPARWNKHYLLPRDPAIFSGANASKVGTDPVPAFVPPDWVYVTEKGPEVLTVSQRNVIGRYAFAIYDEGGLLDINVAGYPSNTPVETKPHPAPNPNNRPSWGSGKKEALTFADLTVLGLTQDEVDQIVGWRNFATAQPTGTFPAFAFDTAAALRVHEQALANDSGFLEVSGTTWLSGGQTKTDQMFTSRQQLLKFRNQVGFSQDALQYLGTFSRSLEEPSYVPNPARPKIHANQNTNNASFGRGNDAFGVTERNVGNPSLDINPPIPEIRVKTAFIRPDGTTAVVGDPLLKHRFPLARLKKILRTATADKDDDDPIYRDFGIYRASASDPWLYDHGDPTGILRMDAVASRGREPDFFEILKAGIEIGSLGKTAAFTNFDVPGSFVNVIFQQAALTGLHTLQIGANIIDQADEDGYPTRVAFSGNVNRVVSGVEDLPYIYHLRNRPSFPSFGLCRWLIQPVMWNPHDPGGKDPTDAPGLFRVRAEPRDPAQAGQFIVEYRAFGSPPPPSQPFEMEWNNPTSSFLPYITFNAGESNGHHGFRQPALLGEADLPDKSNAEGNDFNQADYDPATALIGIVAAEFLTRVPRTDDPALFTWVQKANLVGLLPGVDFILEYEDGGRWIPYNTMPYWSTATWTMGDSSVNSDATQKTYFTKHFTSGGGLKAIDYQSGNNPPNTYFGRWRGMTRTDPRNERRPSTFSQYIEMLPVLDPTQNIYGTYREGVGVSHGDHQMGIDKDNGFVGDFVGNRPDWLRGHQHGYWAENSVRETRQVGLTTTDPEKRRFNRDPDGIVRRAIGGYATDPASGGDFDNLQGLPLATNNFASRPIILNRPFQSVAELGHVYRGETWKNLSFAFPESGDKALLDLFCIEEPATSEGTVAGKVNLNTRQAPVLAAILAGAMVDEADSTLVYSGSQAGQLADVLVKRTTSADLAAGKGPLVNLSELVGRWNGPALTAANVDPENWYSGFSSDMGVPSLLGTAKALIPRQRETAIRALAANGSVRTWNLFIDVVAQSGKFAADGVVLDKFVVEGEKRYWLHVTIDRLTGEVVDQQWEVVTE